MIIKLPHLQAFVTAHEEWKPGHNCVLRKELLQETSQVNIMQRALRKDIPAFSFWALISQQVCLGYILHTYPTHSVIWNDEVFPCITWSTGSESLSMRVRLL